MVVFGYRRTMLLRHGDGRLTWNEIFPGRLPGKAEIERMYRMAYTVDPKVFRVQDVVDFGLDLHRLKEFGDVRMKKSLAVLRKSCKVLWDRMDDQQKAAFLIGDVITGLRKVSGTLQGLEKVMGPIPEAHEGLEMAQNGLYARIPNDLRGRLDQGFGKWRSNGKG
jgi:hypothetical protein